MNGFKIYTKLLQEGETFLLTSNYNATYFSFQVSSTTGDNATYKGDETNPVTQEASEELPVAAGGGQVFVSENPQKPITGITVTAQQGTVSINIGY